MALLQQLFLMRQANIKSRTTALCSKYGCVSIHSYRVSLDDAISEATYRGILRYNYRYNSDLLSVTQLGLFPE